MEITSAKFLIFVGVSLLIYWKLPAKARWILLLADSLLFYFFSAKAETFIYLLFSLVTVYAATRLFCNSKIRANAKLKKGIVATTVLLNVGILAVLKYTNLGIHTVNAVGSHIGGFEQIPEVRWLAPLAISYYTLQIISYLLDCYWETEEPEKNFAKLALFVCYFPQMISGPICRYGQTGKELTGEHSFDYAQVTRGLRRIAWGILKKTVAADRIAFAVNYMFANPDLYDGFWVWLAVFGFVIELYLDFSGCMDIVFGVSACFGIVLPENFNAPFFSKSVQEFWQRFHITLGTWLRDYIMNPILKSDFCYNMGVYFKKKWGRAQGKKVPVYFAMFFLWSAMGLWHGNSWKYICGEGWWFWLVIVLGQIMEPVFVRVRKLLRMETGKFWQLFRMVRTFLIYSFGMLFFRADSLPAALGLIRSSLRLPAVIEPAHRLYASQWGNMGGIAGIIACAAVLAVVAIADCRQYQGRPVGEKISALPPVVRWIGYYAVVLLVVVFGVFGQSKFIYFQF